MKDVVSASQTVLVQVAKEAISTKGPRLTTEVTLAGRYLVLVPFSSKISISQRISKESERKRSPRVAAEHPPRELWHHRADGGPGKGSCRFACRPRGS